jgi:hypothetical protein
MTQTSRTVVNNIDPPLYLTLVGGMLASVKYE